MRFLERSFNNKRKEEKVATEDQLTKDIADLQNQLEEAQRKLAERQSLPEEQRLALDLHDIMCGHQITGRCEWGMNGSWDTNYEMKQYLTKAQRLLDYISYDEAIKVVSIAFGRD